MSKLANIVIQNHKTMMYNEDGSLKTTIPTNSFMETIVNTWVTKSKSINFSLSLPTGCKGFFTNVDYKIFVIEHPPAWHNIKINKSLRHLNNRMREQMEVMMKTSIKQKNIFRIYFPYMIFVLAFSENETTHGFNFKVFCRPAPLTSLNDRLFKLPLPNFYGDQSVCMPPFYIDAADNYHNASSELINNFWASVYNSDITNNILTNKLNEAPFNYYLWEKISNDNPLAASMLNFEADPDDLQTIFEGYKYSEYIKNEKNKNSLLNSTFNLFDGSETSNSDIFKNMAKFYNYEILGYVSSRCFPSKYGECILKINTEFDMNDKTYKVINFSRDRGNSNNCNIVCSSTDNPDHTTVFSESVIEKNINNIYISILEKEKQLIKKTRFFDLILKSEDIVVLKPINNIPYYVLKTISHFTRDIYENLILVTSEGEQFNLANSEKNIHKINKQTRIKINGIPVTTKTQLFKFDVGSNGMLTCFLDNTYNCTCTDINELKIDHVASIFLKNINSNGDYRVEFNLMGVKDNYLMLSSPTKMFLTRKIIKEGIPIKYLVKYDGSIKKSTTLGDIIICNIDNKEYIVKLSQSSYNLDRFSFDKQIENGIIIADNHEIDVFKRQYKIGDKVIITKLQNYLLEDGTIYTIDSFSTSEDKTSLIVNLISEDGRKTSLPLIDQNSKFNRFIIRKAVSEYGGIKVGDTITRNSSSFKRPHIAKNYRYIVKAIVTDCGNDPLVIFENGISLYFSDVANYFDIVSDNDSNLKIPEDIYSNDDFYTYYSSKSISHLCINVINYNGMYGIPRPSLYKYEKSFIDYTESIYYSNLKRGAN